MANKIANRVKMTVASVASSGTGDITLGSSVPGYLTFAEGGVSNTDTVPYVLEAANGDWEIGVGTYTSSGTVLARTTVTKSVIGGVVGTSKITASSTTIVMISPLAADLQSTDTLTSGTLGVARGGTGQTSYTTGDLLYASSSSALSALAGVETGNALISGGVGTAPSWGKVGLSTHVSGTLPVANGGTNASSAGITAFNNITGYTASGATGTTSTNLVFSTSPSITTPTFVTSATGPLFIGGTAASSSLTLQSTSGVGTSDSIVFKVGNNGGTTAATINTSGYFGIGTTSNTTSILMTSATVANQSAAIGTIGATTLRVQNLSTANIGTSSKLYLDIGGLGGAVVQGYYAAFNGSTDIGVGLAFATQLNSAGGPTERMRIDSSGNLLVGTTTTSHGRLGVVQTTASSTAATIVGVSGATLLLDYQGNGIFYADSDDFQFRSKTSTFRAGIKNALTGGATTLSVDANGYIIRTPSDRKLKVNDVTIPYGLSIVQQMRPIIHEWTKDANMGDSKSIGFIADEIATLIPEVVSGDDIKSLDYPKLTAVLTKAIQELAAKVSALEARQ